MMSGVVLACGLVTFYFVYSRGLVKCGPSHYLLFGVFIIFEDIVFMDSDSCYVFFDRLLPFSKLSEYRCRTRF
jgi:hypothetical protein